jgi:hypothetical protein
MSRDPWRRVARIHRVRALALALVLVAPWHTYRAHGVSVRYPPAWHATRRALTHVTSPRQVLAVASYPLPRDNRGDDGCSPKQALDALPPGGAFVFAWEDDDPGAPPRPAHFRLTGLAQYECLGRSYRIAFRDHNRSFVVHVVLGRRASAATRAKVLQILESFRS